MDVLRLWEVSPPEVWWRWRVLLRLTSPTSRPQVMWTDLPCLNFHLLVCCAILDSEKQKIMEENYGFNEILKVRRCCPVVSELGKKAKLRFMNVVRVSPCSTSTSFR